jgi:hypothetical protein
MTDTKLEGKRIKFVGVWDRGAAIITGTEGRINQVVRVNNAGEILVKGGQYTSNEMPINDGKDRITISDDGKKMYISRLQGNGYMMSVYEILDRPTYRG